MCGIVGVWNLKEKQIVDEGLITKLRNTLTHRGPDDVGVYVDGKYGLAFGHQRLSIIDLAPSGHQPMSNDDGTLWITYNGEIYNYQELRKILIEKGHRFKSTSDTEVILRSYEEWGPEMVHRFRGMFALAIWDRTKEKLILFRDRVGVKPLYYYIQDNLFLFGSELKAFHKHPEFVKEIDPDALALFFRFGYIPGPHSIFKHTYKVKPGHYLEITRDRKVKETKYWDVIDYYFQPPLEKSEEEIETEFEKILIESFQYRMVSDVPVGVFLSGGVDSSLVTALLQKNSPKPLKTFTIGFYEKKCDEAPWAKKIAHHLGTDHQELYLSIKEVPEILSRFPELYDEPFGDSSGIPTYLVSRFAKEHVKVALSADGGDELFCGYDKYKKIEEFYTNINRVPGIISSLLPHLLLFFSPALAERIYRVFSPPLPKRLYIQDKFSKLKDVLKARKNFSQVFQTMNSYWNSDDISKLIITPYNSRSSYFDEFEKLSSLDLISQMQAVDFKTYLVDDILTKVDRATMAVGLEGRDPFLDQHIIEYAARLPIEYKYRNKETKYILRKILYKYVPRNLIERPKRGFSIPIQEWFRGDLSGFLQEYLGREKIKKQGILNPFHVNGHVKRYLEGKSDNIHQLWLLLVFEMWYEKWMKS